MEHRSGEALKDRLAWSQAALVIAGLSIVTWGLVIFLIWLA
jgi:hypothetical protein